MTRKVMVLSLTALILFVFLGAALLALAPKVRADAGAVESANRLVESGHFAEAIQIYEQLLAQGVEDGALYYNLGNAYYQQGDLGRAILSYQRAARLSPRDGDIKANLELARQQARQSTAPVGLNPALDPLAVEAPGPLTSLANLTAGWLTLNELAALALAFWFLAGLFLLGRRMLDPGKLRSTLQLALVLVLLVVALGGLSLGSRLVQERTQPEGVVVAPVVALSTEPGQDFVTAVNLHNGAEVKLVERQGEWARLAGPGNGLEGWIPLAAVETVL